MSNVRDYTLAEFKTGLREKKFSALEATQEYFSAIKDVNDSLGVYLSLDEAGALSEAEAVDVALARGDDVPVLAGVPFAIKDNILVKGLRATAGSKLLENYTASYDATVISRLRRAKSIFLGKTNLDEFAMGSSTENSAFQITRNPHDETRVPGGSSGGSTAAVAARLALAALGSDTGGSIRQPAAFCGVVGLKPTYGSVSRSGLVSLASSLDQIGPITKTVRDAELIFNVIAGSDRKDGTSTPSAKRKSNKPTSEESKKMIVGIPKEYFSNDVDPEVGRELERAISRFQSFGLRIKEISLPHTRYSLSSYYIILPAEASSNLARFDGVRYARIPLDSAEHEASNLKDLYFKQRGFGFGSEPKRRIILGTFVLSSGYYDSYYKKAQQVRTLITQDFERAFDEVNVIFAPVTPTTAFPIGEKSADPLEMYKSDIFTLPVNLAGLPALSVPIRRTEGLPVGFQLIGNHNREGDLFALGELYEEEQT